MSHHKSVHRNPSDKRTRLYIQLQFGTLAAFMVDTSAGVEFGKWKQFKKEKSELS